MVHGLKELFKFKVLRPSYRSSDSLVTVIMSCSNIPEEAIGAEPAEETLMPRKSTPAVAGGLFELIHTLICSIQERKRSRVSVSSVE